MLSAKSDYSNIQNFNLQAFQKSELSCELSPSKAFSELKISLLLQLPEKQQTHLKLKLQKCC